MGISSKDGIEMRSPLGSVLADVFMDKLRITIVPFLREYLGF